MLASILFNALKQRSIQVILLLTIYLSCANYLPLTAHQGLYTISLFIKDLLVWFLPLSVGLFIAYAIASFQRHAPLFVIALVIFEGISNFSSVIYSYLGGLISMSSISQIDIVSIQANFEPLARLPFLKPSWWSADKGTLLGLCLGLLVSWGNSGPLRSLVEKGKEIAEWILTKIFAKLIPLFILGFVARMLQTNILSQIYSHYAFLIVWLLFFLLFYISLIFFIAAKGSFKTMFTHIRNLLPAAGISFLSGCSLSTMPWTIEGTAKNLKNPQLAKAVIPATTNIQQIGDCITNAFLCFLIYRTFYGHNPDFITWLSFTSIFTLARFATAAVIGGAIFLMLPIYERYLGFNPEMIAMILAFNVILDPIVTSMNVLANGALCPLFERVLDKLLHVSRFWFRKPPEQV